jgi:hypothetical protein
MESNASRLTELVSSLRHYMCENMLIDVNKRTRYKAAL